MGKDVIVIADVSSSYFSVAKYSGGVKYNGTTFLYCPIRDILVREDWIKVYQRLSYSKFIEAVKSGVKPKLISEVKAKKTKKKKVTNIETPSLFD